MHSIVYFVGKRSLLEMVEREREREKEIERGVVDG
jgi:hypothetical protein